MSKARSHVITTFFSTSTTAGSSHSTVEDGHKIVDIPNFGKVADFEEPYYIPSVLFNEDSLMMAYMTT